MTFEEHYAAFERDCIEQGHAPSMCPACSAQQTEVWERTEKARADYKAFALLPIERQREIIAAEEKVILDKYYPLPEGKRIPRLGPTMGRSAVED